MSEWSLRLAELADIPAIADIIPLSVREGTPSLRGLISYTVEMAKLPKGRKKYSKAAPIQFEEFAPARAWWTQRAEGPQSWKVSAEDVAAKGFNLDLKNPNARTGLAHADP